MLEQANESLPTGYAPDARFVATPSGPGCKPGRVWANVNCRHRLCALYLDDSFMHIRVPHAGPFVSPTNHPLVIPRCSNGAQLHSRLLSDLFTVCKPPPSNPITTTAQKMLSVMMEYDCQNRTRTTGVKDYCWVLLNCQHLTIAARNCYVPVSVDDILTNGTQSWGSKSERTRCVRFIRGARSCCA